MQTNAHFGHSAYRRGQIASANPVRIIVLLYEGAIRFTRQAMEKFDEPAIRGYALGRAHRIVSELLAALDHDAGGEIATNLDALYRFLLDEITCANVAGERGRLNGVVDVLGSLVGAWREIEAKPDAAGDQGP